MNAGTGDLNLHVMLGLRVNAGPALPLLILRRTGLYEFKTARLHVLIGMVQRKLNAIFGSLTTTYERDG